MYDTLNLQLEATKQRLRDWGHWYKHIALTGIGYSRKSIIGQLVDAKGTLIKSTAYHIKDNDETEEVDELIQQLLKIDHKRAVVLKLHYLEEMKFNEKVKYSKLSESTYKRYLERAEEWIDSHLHS